MAKTPKEMAKIREDRKREKISAALGQDNLREVNLIKTETRDATNMLFKIQDIEFIIKRTRMTMGLTLKVEDGAKIIEKGQEIVRLMDELINDATVLEIARPRKTKIKASVSQEIE